MSNKDAIITLEIGMYSHSEEFYFLYNEEKGSFDSVFLQGLLFADYIFKVYLETDNSIHSETFADFLSNLTQEDVEILTIEKEEFPIFNPDETSPGDIHFFLELLYSEEKHVFSFENQGNWYEKDLYKFDIVNSVIELISFLGKKNIQMNSFYNFIVEIANNSGEYFKKSNFKDEDITKDSFLIVIIAYDNFLKDLAFM